MGEEEYAYEAALEIIARKTETKATEVNFNRPQCRALTRIPPELGELQTLTVVDLGDTRITELSPLAGLTELQNLWLNQTGVSDLSPLAGLTGLKNLRLDRTEVKDLRPIRGAEGLVNGNWGLRFDDTPATRMDAELLRLSQLKDNSQRGCETLAYLNSLPPWPEPYTPTARPDGKPPQPIGGDVDHGQTPAKPRQAPVRAEPPMSRGAVMVKTSATQIKFLLREPQMTQMTAQGVAEHIRAALGEARSRTNDLPEALLALEGVADALQELGAARIGPKDKNRIEELQLRIAYLEASLEKLTEELNAAKAAVKSDGFGASFSKESGVQAAQLLGQLTRFGIVGGMLFFIGTNNTLAARFIEAWAAASKFLK
jgi:Leucine-rich repeat (LRR) protein